MFCLSFHGFTLLLTLLVAIHLCVHVNGELYSFITVYNAKCIKVRYLQGNFLSVFFFDERRLYKHSIASSEFLAMSQVFTDIPYITSDIPDFYWPFISFSSCELYWVFHFQLFHREHVLWRLEWCLLEAVFWQQLVGIQTQGRHHTKSTDLYEGT